MQFFLHLGGMRVSEPVRKLQIRNHTFETFFINQLVHIHQKEKIAVEIAAFLTQKLLLVDEKIVLYGYLAWPIPR